MSYYYGGQAQRLWVYPKENQINRWKSAHCAVPDLFTLAIGSFYWFYQYVGIKTRTMLCRRCLTKVCMCLCFTRCQALLVVIAQEFVQEVNGFVRCVSLVLWRDELRPVFSGISGGSSHRKFIPSHRLRSPSKDVFILDIKPYVIFVDVCI